MYQAWVGKPRHLDYHLMYQRLATFTPNVKPLQDALQVPHRPHGNVIMYENLTIAGDRRFPGKYFLSTMTRDEAGFRPCSIHDTGVHIKEFNRFCLAVGAAAFGLNEKVNQASLLQSQAPVTQSTLDLFTPSAQPPAKRHRGPSSQ